METAVIVGMVGLAVLFIVLAWLGLDQTFSLGWSGGSAPSVSSAETFTGNTALETEFTIASGTVVDQEQTFGFGPIAGIKAILIVVTGNALAPVTMKTNSTSSADDTLVFPASSRGSHYLWDELFPTIDGTSANPFDATVTTTYWSHNAAEEVTVKIRILFNG